MIYTISAYKTFMNRGSIVTSLIISLIFIFISETNSQCVADKELMTLFNRVDTQPGGYTKVFKESENEIDITISTFFIFYKTFISSQDMPTCIFTPSCSEYAVEALQKKGLFIGWLITFDRLSRCHGLVKQEHYHFDMDKKRFYDPVR